MDVSTTRGRGTRYALAGSIALNLVMASALFWPEPDPTTDIPVEDPSAAVAQEAAAPTELAEASPEAAAEAEVAAAAPEAQEAAEGDVRITVARVEGSIPQTMAVAAEPYGEFVSATLSRLLVWDLDVRRDLRAGDKVETMWSLGTTDTVVIEAARFHAQKFNKDITAYRFKASGDEYASYWSADGTEVPHRLKNSPMRDYEQITSLLKDRPNHQGMDFKVPVGTDVLATAPGVVTRSNWNWGANGNCLEIRHDDGVLAKYLHLSDNKVKPGDRVKPGDVIALSGNTGRSTGPHLHYQLNRGTKVIDPIDYHGTERRKLSESDRVAFQSLVDEANAKLDEAQELALR